MTADELRQLLQHAEPATAEAPPAITPEGLLAQARRRRTRRAAVRSLAAAAVVAALIAAPFIVSRSSQPQLAANSPPEGPKIPAPFPPAINPLPRHVEVQIDAEIQLELARLDRAAAMQTEILRRVMADADAADLEESLVGSALSDADLVRAETARSAALSLQYAVLAERELHDLEAARREYERVAERFPGTEWAEVAQVSLERLKPIDPMPL